MDRNNVSRNGGRFTPGNPGGPGRPVGAFNAFSRRQAALRLRLVDAVEAEGVVEAIGKALLDAALAGNIAAAELLLRYACGGPVDAVHPDELDHDEYAKRMNTPGALEQLLLATH